MSVDANVLIFERIREEVKKGAQPRMAVRNGFGKATVTIVDANLTTLITAIVLYAIGTDQIRGFAVTLILGILFSMFTAIFVSRTFFDVAERKGFLSLAMADTVNAAVSRDGRAPVNFIGMGKVSLVVSLLLCTVGVASLFARGSNIFDIDFAGGSSVQFRLEQPAQTDQVRSALASSIVKDGEPVPFTVNEVSISDVPENTVYKVDSGLEKVEDLQESITRAFANDPNLNLTTGEASVRRDANAATAARRAVRLVQETAEATINVGDDGNVSIDATDESHEPAADGDTVSRIITFGTADAPAAINADTLLSQIKNAAEDVGVGLTERSVQLSPVGEGSENYAPGSSLKFSQWRVTLPLDEASADAVMNETAELASSQPLWISSSSVGSRVAGDMIGRAGGALFASLLCIIGYIWFRFQRVIYGLAAVVALIHDVLITLGAIAVSYWLADVLGFLQIDPFKISLTVVAALLTIIGYSLNDTIVVFDRIRETKGKAPRLTADMINHSISQTLSRTLLTSLTTLIVVVLLYFFGGEGIHAFAFALVVGVIVGTYSSIFVASPVLHFLVKRGDAAAA